MITKYLNLAQKLTEAMNGALLRGRIAYEYSVGVGFEHGEENGGSKMAIDPCKGWQEGEVTV